MSYQSGDACPHCQQGELFIRSTHRRAEMATSYLRCNNENGCSFGVMIVRDVSTIRRRRRRPRGIVVITPDSAQQVHDGSRSMRDNPVAMDTAGNRR